MESTFIRELVQPATADLAPFLRRTRRLKLESLKRGRFASIGPREADDTE